MKYTLYKKFNAFISIITKENLQTKVGNVVDYKITSNLNTVGAILVLFIYKPVVSISEM